MKQEQFDEILKRRIDQTYTTAGAKGKEYSGSQGDRLHNFKQSAVMSAKKETQAEALWGMWRKHLVSIMDMIEASKNGKVVGRKKMDEKLGDCVVYSILMEAVFTEEDEKLLAGIKERSQGAADVLFGRIGAFVGEEPIKVCDIPAGTTIDKRILNSVFTNKFEGGRDAAGICTCSIHNR